MSEFIQITATFVFYEALLLTVAAVAAFGVTADERARQRRKARRRKAETGRTN